MANTIEVILKSKDEATPSIKAFGLSLTDLKSGIQMVGQAVQKTAQAMQAVWDFTKEGAAVLQTTDSFNRLGISIESLRAASLGTVDDMTLMKASLTLTAGASEQLQGQLLQNAPQLLAIAKAANALNPTLGDTAFMYDSIATGVKRASPMILDNLGIVVKIDEANRAYAATLGKTVEQLTAEEKQIALLNGTIEAGARLIEQTGGSIEAYGDAWARLQVEIKNSTDALKANSAEIAGPVIGRYADFLQLTRESEKGLIGFGAAARYATYMLTGNEKALSFVTYAVDMLTFNWADAVRVLDADNVALEEYSNKLEHASAAAKNLTGDTKALTDAQKAERLVLESMRTTLETTRVLTSSIAETQARLGAEALSSAEAWDIYSAAISGSEQASADYYAEANRLRDIAAAQAQGEANVAAVHSDLTERLEEGSTALGDLYDERSDILRQIQELEAANGRAITTQARSNLTENEAVLVTLQLADAQAKLAAETDPLKAAQLAVKVEDLTGKLSGATAATTTFIDNSKRIAELQGDYAALGEEIDGVTAAIKETIDAFIIQQLESRLAIDGWNEAENELFLTLAQGLGVFDEQHAALAASIFDIAASVDGVGESTEEAWANAIAGAAQLLGMSEEVVAKYVDMAVAAGDASGAIDSIASASDGVHESVSNVGKGGTAALQDLTSEAETEIERLAAMGNAADTAYGQISSLGKDGATDLAEIGTEAVIGGDNLTALGDAAVTTQGLISTMALTNAEELAAVGNAADTTLGQVDTLGATGSNSLKQIDEAARGNVREIEAVGTAADAAQARIDAMTGKDIYIDVYIREHGGGGVTPPSDTNVPPGGNPYQAMGGDYYVNRPTPFIAGEAGWERAIFIPQGKPGFDATSVAAAAAAVSGGGTPSTNNSRTVNIINPLFQGPQTASVRALSQMEF